MLHIIEAAVSLISSLNCNLYNKLIVYFSLLSSSSKFVKVTTRIDTAGSELQTQSEKQVTGQVSSDGTFSSSTETIIKEKSGDDPVVVVFVVENSKALMKEVTTGIQDNNFIEIKEGLEKDDQVVVAPYSAISRQLKNDLNVDVVSQEELFKGNDKDKNKD